MGNLSGEGREDELCSEVWLQGRDDHLADGGWRVARYHPATSVFVASSGAALRGGERRHLEEGMI